MPQDTDEIYLKPEIKSSSTKPDCGRKSCGRIVDMNFSTKANFTYKKIVQASKGGI